MKILSNKTKSNYIFLIVHEKYKKKIYEEIIQKELIKKLN